MMRDITQTLADGFTVAQRNVIKIKRVPEVLVAVVITPLVVVVLFAYVFGSAIDTAGGSSREFVVGGTFAMTVTFGAMFTGAGIADDMQKGVIDRFRSLPMARSAVVLGRTTSDVIYNAASLVVIALAGSVIGWRVHNGVLDALLGFGLLLLFAYAISWMMAYIGLLVPSVEVINNASMIVVFPLTFLADTFVPSESFPPPLRVFAEWNPVSAVTRAARGLFGNTPTELPEPRAWSLQHPVLYSLIWTALVTAVFAPLSVRRYTRVGDKK